MRWPRMTLGAGGFEMPKERGRVHFLSVVFAAVMIFVSCGPGTSSESHLALDDPTNELPARFKSQGPVPKPDFSTASRSPAFQQAIKDASALFGVQPQPLVSEAQGEEVIGGVSFDVPQKKLEAVLQRAHTDFLSRGFYLFRY